MKTAKIIRKYHGNMQDTAFLIEDEADLANYEKFTQGAAGELIRKALASDLPPYKLDHLLPGRPSLSLGIMRAAINAATVNSFREEFSIFNNPFWQLLPAAAIKIATIRRLLADGYPVIVNNAGGFMSCKPRDIKILEVFDSKPQWSAPDDVIKKRTRYIVLENDWELPEESAGYLARVDPNYSIIYDLRGHSRHLLTARLQRFKDNGGHTVFVYTTGLDVRQMYSYSDAAIAAGLKQVVFYFTSGLTPPIREYLSEYKSRLSITVLNSLNVPEAGSGELARLS